MNFLIPFVLLFFPHVGVKQKVSLSIWWVCYYFLLNLILYLGFNNVFPVDKDIVQSVAFEYVLMYYLGTVGRIVFIGIVAGVFLRRKKYFNVNFIQLLNVFQVTMLPILISHILPFNDWFVRLCFFTWEMALVAFLLKNLWKVSLKDTAITIIISTVVLYVSLISFMGIKM